MDNMICPNPNCGYRGEPFFVRWLAAIILGIAWCWENRVLPVLLMFCVFTIAGCIGEDYGPPYTDKQMEAVNAARAYVKEHAPELVSEDINVVVETFGITVVGADSWQVALKNVGDEWEVQDFEDTRRKHDPN